MTFPARRVALVLATALLLALTACGDDTPAADAPRTEDTPRPPVPAVIKPQPTVTATQHDR